MQRLMTTAMLAACVAAATTPAAQAVVFDNDAGDGLWTNPLNWENDTAPGATDEAELFLESLNNPLPVVDGLPTVIINGNVTVGEFVMGGGSDTDFGDIQLQVTNGAPLAFDGDSRVGSGGDGAVDPGFLGTTARLLQSDGTITVTGGSGTDIKLAGDGRDFSPNGVYSIQGSSVLTSTGTINFNRPDHTNAAEKAIFEVVGSNASITIEDVKTESNVPPGVAIMRFVLDAGGASTIVVNDDFQMENLGLELSLSAAPPAGDIVLAQADRLSNDNQFVGLADGADVSAVFGLNQYTWTINYFDSSDDATLIDAVVLSNLRVTAIPEPASLALLTLGGLAMLRRRAA